MAPAARVAGMRAKPCLPPCTDARGPLCLELVDGDGKLCEPRDGPAACSGLRSCGPDCANQWLSPVQLFRSITRRHHWLLFIGDSDTRGLIIGLLQLLATAGYGAELASQSRALWLGGANNDSQAVGHTGFEPQSSRPQTILLLTRASLALDRVVCATSTFRTTLMLGS